MTDASSIFIAAANLLSGGLSTNDATFNTKVVHLLDNMGLNLANGQSEDEVVRRDWIGLLRAAADFGTIFRLRSHSAPGLVFFGGFTAPTAKNCDISPEPSVSISGAGETAAEAFRACIGEGVEYAAQFATPETHLRAGTPADAISWNGGAHVPSVLDWIGTNKVIDWIRAEQLRDGREIWLPACLVLRLQDDKRWAVGSGCAAGPTLAAARRAAFFEIIERDAVAMWWRGGRELRTITPDQRATLGADDLLDRIRQGQHDRITSLFQIKCDFGLTCVAAVSFDMYGRDFAGGYACNSDPTQACRSAIREMCQMELGNNILAAKLARAQDISSAADHVIYHRSTVIRPDAPQLKAVVPAFMPAEETLDFEEAVTRLAAAGFESYAVDLTTKRSGVPVMKIVVPGLQPYPSTFVTPRLASAMSARNDSAGVPEVDLL